MNNNYSNMILANKNNHTRKVWSYLFVFALLGSMSQSSIAQDVVLNPASIQGTIKVEGYTVSNARALADGSAFGSATQSIAPNAAEGMYDLTVNVPEGETTTYRVWADRVRLRDDSNNIYTTQFNYQFVDVEATSPAVSDFIVEEPSFIQGSVSIDNSSTVNLQKVNLSLFSSEATISKVQFTKTIDSASFEFRMPVTAGTYSCGGSFDLSNDTQQSANRQNVTVAAGDTATCDIAISVVQPGSISGNINYSGDVAIDSFRVKANGVDPTTVDAIAVDNGAPFLIENLTPSVYSMQIEAIANSNDDRYTFSGSPLNGGSGRVTVQENANTIYDVETCQSYINGEFIVSGSVTNADISVGTMLGNSDNGSSFDILMGSAYDLLASEGLWRIRPGNIRFRNSEEGKPDIDNTLKFSQFVTESTPIVCGQTLLPADMGISTGIVTLNYQVLNGDLLSNPRITGSCTKKDESNNVLYRYTVNTAAISLNGVSEASLRLALADSDCRLVARANVNGSNTEFGDINITVIGGTDVDIDIGAPTLAVTSPEPGQCTAAESVVVQGTVNDDTEIAEVTVNGANVVLTPIDPEGFAFSFEVALAGGTNVLTIAASDTSGNTIIDERSVLQSTNPPALQWTPAAQAIVYQPSVIVEGTVSDENDIQSLMVNGSLQMLVPTGVANEYSFSTEIALVEGENVITLVASDSTGCEDTVQVRAVEYQTQPEPSGITRSKGYWKNHPQAITAVLNQYGAVSQCGAVQLMDTCDIVDALSLKGNKNNANAKRQSVAASLNCLAFGCSEEIDPQADCSNALGNSLDDFNNTGTGLPLPADFQGYPSEPKYCK